MERSIMKLVYYITDTETECKVPGGGNLLD